MRCHASVVDGVVGGEKRRKGALARFIALFTTLAWHLIRAGETLWSGRGPEVASERPPEPSPFFFQRGKTGITAEKLFPRWNCQKNAGKSGSDADSDFFGLKFLCTPLTKFFRDDPINSSIFLTESDGPIDFHRLPLFGGSCTTCRKNEDFAPAGGGHSTSHRPVVLGLPRPQLFADHPGELAAIASIDGWSRPSVPL